MSLAMKKALSLLLCVLLLSASLASCGAHTELPPDTDPVESASNGGTETEQADPVQEALDALIPSADWGGKDFGILYVNDIGGYTEEVEAVPKSTDASSSAVINDAVYERNTLFSEYCNLNFVLIPTSNGMVDTSIKAEVQTGTGDVHLITRSTDGAAESALLGHLFSYLDLNINYEKPWWDAQTLNFAMCGKVFFMDGPFNIVDDDVTFIMLFNKELREQYHVDDPYQTVENGEWTLDYFNSVISTLSTDNGDGKWNELDTYGFATPNSIGATFFYGAGLQYVINNRDMDRPELALDASKMERALNTLEKARTIVHKNNSSFIGDGMDTDKSLGIFVEGRSLFFSQAASYLRYLNSNMEAEYGVLPIPKYDASQEKYHTWRAAIGSTLSIPTTVASMDVDMFAKVLEVYCLLSQKLVRPAYYDTMLTIRNVRDPESSEILDMVFSNRIYDMGIFFNTLGFSPLFMQSVIGENTFSSSYAATARGFEKKIELMIRKLQGAA